MIRGLKHSVVLGEDNLMHSEQWTGETTKILRISNNKSIINL